MIFDTRAKKKWPEGIKRDSAMHLCFPIKNHQVRLSFICSRFYVLVVVNHEHSPSIFTYCGSGEYRSYPFGLLSGGLSNLTQDPKSASLAASWTVIIILALDSSVWTYPCIRRNTSALAMSRAYCTEVCALSMRPWKCNLYYNCVMFNCSTYVKRWLG